MNRKELDWLMGMYEMEEALDVMLDKSEATGVPFEKLKVYHQDFKNKGLTGFCILLVNQWMRTGYPNGTFGPRKKLIERMRERSCWEKMPDPPTEEEWWTIPLFIAPGVAK